MDDQLFTVHYNFKGVTNKWLQKRMSRELMEVYNLFADMGNKVIGSINHAWNLLHPGIEKLEEGTPMWDAYCQFVAACYNSEVVDKINKRHIFGLMKFVFVADDLYLQGHLRWNRKATVDFYMLPFKN
jgi:hypothetical protein